MISFRFFLKPAQEKFAKYIPLATRPEPELFQKTFPVGVVTGKVFMQDPATLNSEMLPLRAPPGNVHESSMPLFAAPKDRELKAPPFAETGFHRTALTCMGK